MLRPWIIIHCILSVDGRLTTARGLRTRWEDVTPDAVGEYYRLSRYLGAQGILISANALDVAEQALKELRDETRPDRPAPVLIVPDARGRVNWTLLRRMPWLGQVIVLCSETTPPAFLTYLSEEGLSYVVAGPHDVDMPRALEMVWSQHRLNLIQCQGGSALNGELLRHGLADELSLVVAPIAVGGTRTPTLFDAPDLEDVAQITRLRLSSCQGLKGGALWLRYDIDHGDDEG
jgi:2,5-diamino-6-(ribosylamino)-4(3H)-pyrimidinone 5'-phosphate reductase